MEFGNLLEACWQPCLIPSRGKSSETLIVRTHCMFSVCVCVFMKTSVNTQLYTHLIKFLFFYKILPKLTMIGVLTSIA